MDQATLTSLTLLAAAAVLAPLISHRLSRWVLVPAVVLEIGLGILIGPQMLQWAHEDDVISTFSEIGLAMLIFMAGYEIDFAHVRGTPLRLAVRGWFISLALGLGFAALVSGFAMRALVVGLCLTTTALGTILPVVRDAGLIPTPLGARILAIGAVGEFAPIIAMSLLLTTDYPARTTVLLIVFGLIAFGAAALARRPRPPAMVRLLRATLGTSAQLAVRMTILVLLALVWVAGAFGLDILLGAFAAGMVIRLAVATVDDDVVHVVESKLEAVGFGFLIPIFFVVSGMNFDVRSLDGLGPILKMIVFWVLLLLVRGIPVLVLHQRDLPPAPRKALALMASAGLPLIVVITGIGVENGSIDSATAAALVAAGALSVLTYPVAALRFASEGNQ